MKEIAVKAFGGKCASCGYNKCTAALTFHHLDPSKKEFGIGKIRANSKSWNEIVKELRKCIMLCSNCHLEHHNMNVEIPKNAPRFNEKYSKLKKENIKYCKQCSKKINTRNKLYCSISCSNKNKTKADYSKLNDLLAQGLSIPKAAKILGVSNVAVYKHLKKD